MPIDHPSITVLMPAYNAAKYIGEAIESVLSQSFGDFELVIVNDGSTDDTVKVVRSFSDPRIKLIHQSNMGIAAALNKGLSVANAPFIARFDADDICLPDRLKIQFEFIKAHPDYIIVGSDADFIDMYDNHVFTYSPGWHSNEEIAELDKNICPFIHSTVIYKKEIIIKAGGYDVNAYAFEDHLLWMKILKEGKVCNLPEVLLKVRLNPESITIDEKWHHKRFIELKYNAIQKGTITEAEGQEIKNLLKQQHNSKIKEGAYYSLLGKKYLWNNYQPAKARTNLRMTLSFQPWDLKTWGLLMLSYLPGDFIQGLYDRRGLKNKKARC
jgi:glycosyltransferase involved in cell wall biosynthesis